MRKTMSDCANKTYTVFLFNNRYTNNTENNIKNTIKFTKKNRVL